MLKIPVPVFKCEQNKEKKSKSTFSYILRKKKMYYEIPLSMCVQESECCILLLLDTGCSLYILKMKSKWLYNQNQDFCFQIKSYYFIFSKKVGNTAKISTCISERIVQFLKLLLYYPTRSNFLLGFLLLYLNEFRFFPPFFLPMNCNFILFKNVVQYSNSKLSKLSNM